MVNTSAVVISDPAYVEALPGLIRLMGGPEEAIDTLIQAGLAEEVDLDQIVA